MNPFVALGGPCDCCCQWFNSGRACFQSHLSEVLTWTLCVLWPSQADPNDPELFIINFGQIRSGDKFRVAVHFFQPLLFQAVRFNEMSDKQQVVVHHCIHYTPMWHVFALNASCVSVTCIVLLHSQGKVLAVIFEGEFVG